MKKRNKSKLYKNGFLNSRNCGKFPQSIQDGNLYTDDGKPKN